MNERGLVIDEGEARRLTRSGDERATAFAGLADRHLARAYRLATVILGSEADAQDAVQDAAVAAWERFGDLRDRERFDAWFNRIPVNGCRDRLRRRGGAPTSRSTLPARSRRALGCRRRWRSPRTTRRWCHRRRGRGFRLAAFDDVMLVSATFATGSCEIRAGALQP